MIALRYSKSNHSFLSFKSPLMVISTRLNASVLESLHEIEKLVNSRNLYAIGFVCYEAAPAFDHALRVHDPISYLPLVHFGLFESYETIPAEHLLKAVSKPPASGAKDSRVPNEALLRTNSGPIWRKNNEIRGKKTRESHQQKVLQQPLDMCSLTSLQWHPTISQSEYKTAIGQIKEYIRDGATYQVNFTFRMHSCFNDTPSNLFFTLFRAQPTDGSCFIETNSFAVCSVSPELFFSLSANRLCTKPMKGTNARGLTFADDQQSARWLRNSEKNRAENVMIVDMIRNDIGRVAQTGTVCVEDLFSVEQYPTVWQMTSTITGRTGCSVTDIFKALFPCASITGAPKVKTMELLHSLEKTPRGIYTGAVGYIFPNRKVSFNVGIRTVTINKQEKRAEYGTGGGIVWDSDEESEYIEASTKAKILTDNVPDFSLLETMLWKPNDGYYLLRLHLRRLVQSARYFSIPLEMKTIEQNLIVTTRPFSTPTKVRLLLHRDGTFSVSSSPLPAPQPKKTLRVEFAETPIDFHNRFLYHKTTFRDIYCRALDGHVDVDDVVLRNEKNEITEMTIGNIVAQIDDTLYTPPVSCGLLPGVFRESLIRNGIITERILSPEDLLSAQKIFRINSVRTWEECRLPTTSAPDSEKL
jgi:para-aminobenzoate synthetase / 4-amino-4-deoxychorismate lyase